MTVVSASQTNQNNGAPGGRALQTPDESLRRGGYQPPGNDGAAFQRAADGRPYECLLELR